MTDRNELHELGFYLGTHKGWDGDPGEWAVFYNFLARPDLSLHNFGPGDLCFDYMKNEFELKDSRDETVLAEGTYLSLINEVAVLPKA